VKTHLEQLFDKLDGSTRTEAVTAAARMGLLLIWRPAMRAPV